MRIVGIGGTFRSDSSTEQALRIALTSAESEGCETELIGASVLSLLPIYSFGAADRSAEASALLSAVRQSDGLLMASPGYHGTVSGMVKNAIDFLEELAGDDPPYLTNKPVGCVTTADGAQAASGTLTTLRSIVHSLRGFPTPYGAAITLRPGMFEDGRCFDPRVGEDLALVGQQVASMVRRDPVRPSSGIL